MILIALYVICLTVLTALKIVPAEAYISIMTLLIGYNAGNKIGYTKGKNDLS